MKKSYLISILVIILILIGIFVFYIGYKDNNKQDNNSPKISSNQDEVASVTVEKNEANQNSFNIKGKNNINVYVLNDILEMNNINGVKVNINVKDDEYDGLEASQILKACESSLGIQIPDKNINLANILFASANGMDRIEEQQTVGKIVMKTNDYFKNNHTTKGLYMNTPNKILDEYSPKIKNNDGQNSLYVQMCIFLNEYYNNNSKN